MAPLLRYLSLISIIYKLQQCKEFMLGSDSSEQPYHTPDGTRRLKTNMRPAPASRRQSDATKPPAPGVAPVSRGRLRARPPRPSKVKRLCDLSPRDTMDAELHKLVDEWLRLDKV